jgi:copper(I)-binding protein
MLGLAACGGTAEAPAEAVEGQVPGLTVSNARLVLAPVAGNPAAVYFDLAYEGEQGLTIRKADAEGAGMTMMHDYGEYDFKVQMMEALPVALTKGTKVQFKPGGLHVMAMKPAATLKPGDKVKVTLTMSGGTTQVFEAEVRAAGEER